MASLRPFLSSRILIVLDNAESILDPQGTDAREIYAMVKELVDSVCLLITSRISTVPPGCEILDIPTLSVDAARDTFYRIHKRADRPDLVDKILGQLDFHPLSITLLATAALQNKWSTDRLANKWEQQRTGMLQTMHDESFARTIELSLASPLFQELGQDARGLLEVVAFFPQGVDEDNLDWLFPTIPNRADIFDKFCILSLTYRNGSFITMLAPLRDHLRPQDRLSSPLLCLTKEQYFIRMSVKIDPNDPGFQESWWITSEDVNVEYLLDVFTAIDAKSSSVWDARTNFIKHLSWHKKRLTILKSKIEGLPGDHHSKPECLFELAGLLGSVGNHMECGRLLTCSLTLSRERGDDRTVARTLRFLSKANLHMGLHEEGIKLVEEASQIFEQLGDVMGGARCLKSLATLLESAKQLDDAEKAASHAVSLFSGKGNQFQVCQTNCLLGRIYRSKGKTEEAIHHFDAALKIASSHNWPNELFSNHFALTKLFLEEGRFDDAQLQIDRAKLHVINHTYNLGCTMKLQADLWYKQRRLEEAKAEALGAADVFESLEVASELKVCRELLGQIEKEMDKPVIPGESTDGSDPLVSNDTIHHAH